MQRELARAAGARRLLPWAVASAALAGVLVGVAGGGWRGGATLALLGLGFAAFVAVSSRPRCPACGGSLAPLARAGRKPADPAGARRCPRCRVGFE